MLDTRKPSFYYIPAFSCFIVFHVSFLSCLSIWSSNAFAFIHVCSPMSITLVHFPLVLLDELLLAPYTCSGKLTGVETSWAPAGQSGAVPCCFHLKFRMLWAHYAQMCLRFMESSLNLPINAFLRPLGRVSQ